MSYSQSYTIDVPFSGRESYPASQNGGTIHYSGTTQANVTIYVNTDPFDGSVDKFNRSVDILSGSVVAMNTAQCAAILETGKKVSEELINGFFETINSELSQQMQALDSGIQSTYVLLLKQSMAVSMKKDEMEGAYNRISSEYIKIFKDLDNECYKRIYALDKHSFTLSEKVQNELLSETPSNTAALNLLGIEEASSSKMFIVISSLNRRTFDVLQTLHNYITQELRINTAVNSFLFDENIADKTLFYIPVIWTESDMLEDTSVKQESFIPDSFDDHENKAVTEKTGFFCSGLPQTDWKAMPEPEKEALNKEFRTLAELEFHDADDETEQRIYRTMLSLWQESKLHSLERSV